VDLSQAWNCKAAPQATHFIILYALLPKVSPDICWPLLLDVDFRLSTFISLYYSLDLSAKLTFYLQHWFIFEFTRIYLHIKVNAALSSPHWHVEIRVQTKVGARSLFGSFAKYMLPVKATHY
jgi:hypothetical protein